MENISCSLTINSDSRWAVSLEEGVAKETTDSDEYGMN
jgi:hypothetical protein